MITNAYYINIWYVNDQKNYKCYAFNLMGLSERF